MQDDELAVAFQRVMEEARKIQDLSDIERTDAYEPLKSKIYELLRRGGGPEEMAKEAISWLRQRTQVIRSTKRILEN